MVVTYIQETKGQVYWSSALEDSYGQEEHSYHGYSFASYNYYLKSQFDGHYTLGYFHSTNNYAYKSQFDALRGDM